MRLRPSPGKSSLEAEGGTTASEGSPVGTPPAARDGAAVVLEGVSKRFGAVEAVQNCSLVIPAGSFVSLLGPSGCGKTTLLRMVGGFERQDEGSIWVHGELVDERPPNKRDANMVFQKYALFRHKTVEENIEFPLAVKGVARETRRERIREMLELIHLPDIGDRRPSELSGGQAQRVALARALIAQPSVLLLDEPLAALDRKLRQAMQLELRRIQETIGTTFLFVTHDQEEALAMSDRIVLMEGGRVLQEGTARELYEEPRTAFASQFIGETNLLSGTVLSADHESTRVQLPHGVLDAPPAAVAPGDDVALSVRPQHIHISSKGSAPSIHAPGRQSVAVNHLPGTVDRSIFLGNIMRVLVTVDDNLTLTVECSPQEGRLVYDEASVDLSWPSDRCVIVPG